MKTSSVENRPGSGRIIMSGQALLCCMLWGMAPALIKSGYREMAVSSTGSILLFAGLRFFLAGWLVLGFAALVQKRSVGFGFTEGKKIAVLACLQTFGQYLFYYLGAAHASGMMVSVLSGASALLSLLFSAWIFRLESMSLPKLAGCLLGFAGILIMNLSGGRFSFSMQGEGMIFLSQICSALSAVCIQIFSKDCDPVLLSGWQFVLGGAALSLCGLAMAPSIDWNLTGVIILLLLAGISAGAYTLWGILLSKWPVSAVGVFGCTIGLFGVLFSALFLHESLSLQTAAGAALMSLGIFLVNRIRPKKSRPELHG